MAPARPLAERQNKYFSIEEANRSLPLVKAIVDGYRSPVSPG